jgi:quinol monooxygenase YgiN
MLHPTKVPIMILITGTVLARPETAAELRRLSLEHVHRSRAEPGCLSHDVHVDAENPLRFVFVERWEDAAAVRAHFAVPESRAFARALGGLAAEPPSMHLYQADTVTL